jgi:serine/threonine-protein kinase
LNEARAANAIRHPNIIEILDSGMMADGTPFLVMELLEGESLGTRLRQTGALPIQTAVDFAYQTASALGAAHAKGIVHRDLKPDNLFVVPDPHDTTRERIKVLDFGIAKLQQGSTGDSVKTRTGTLMGTPIYMSPEQCRGTRTIDHRSDIYSLGVIFYEMLIGQPPFVSEGFGDLVNMHLNIQPVSARSRRPEIPPALDALVMKMLAKNPEERYAQMSEIQAALKASGTHQIVSSPDLNRTHAKGMQGTQPTPRHVTTFSTGTGERVETEVVRGKGKMVFVGVLAAVAVAGGVVYWQVAGAGPEVKPPGPVATVTPPKPVAPTTTAPTTPVVPVTPPKPVVTPPPQAPQVPQVAQVPQVPKVQKVELRIASVPAGARVVNNVDGELLGVTPLVLSRPRGGSVTLRVEKDGYAANTRTLPLDGDRAFELTLDQKPKKKEHKPHAEPSTEPAKL